MECLLKAYLQLKINRLSNLNGPRSSHILLNILAPLYLLQFFTTRKSLVLEIDETDLQQFLQERNFVAPFDSFAIDTL